MAPSHHHLAGLNDLSGGDRAILLAVAALFVLPPVIALLLTRRSRDPRLHEGCGEVAPAVIPAVALWAVTVYAVRVATIVLPSGGKPSWAKRKNLAFTPCFCAWNGSEDM